MFYFTIHFIVTKSKFFHLKLSTEKLSNQYGECFKFLTQHSPNLYYYNLYIVKFMLTLDSNSS